MSWKKFFIPITTLLSSSMLLASTAATDAQLQAAIVLANSGADTTINVIADINLVAFGAPLLRPLNSTPSFLPVGQLLTINGSGHLFNGGNNFRGFFVRGGNVQINNLSFINFRAQGGTSPAGGGGGAGMGGALFVGEGATVTLVNPTFTLSHAIGGAGGGILAGTPNRSGGGGGSGGNGGLNGANGGSGGGGGGSLAFNGGNGGPMLGDAAGGGAGVGTNGSTATGDAGANGGNDFDLVSGGGAGGAQDNPGGPGGPGGGGGGAGSSLAVPVGMPGGFGGVGGGGGGGALAFTNGGPGGAGNSFGGGGGGGPNSPLAEQNGNGGPGGPGGFGGGGGNGGPVDQNNNGNGGAGGLGGFGGGGGGGGIGDLSFGAGGSSTFGGGSGDALGHGGGGAGLGGAIFIQTGGAVTIEGSATFTGNTTTPGANGGGTATPGIASGNDIFMQSGSALTFDITSNVTLNHPITGNQGIGGGNTTTGGLTKKGPALLLISGANTFTGLTSVEAGELRFDTSLVTDVQVQSGGTLSGNFTIKKNAAGTNNGDLTNAGRVSPGVDALGTITIRGDFINESTGTLAVGITPQGDNGRLFLSSGNAILNGGIIEVFVNAGTYIDGTQYEVINAPTTGTFSQLIQVGPSADFVVIDISYSSVVLTIINNPIFNPGQFPSEVAQAVATCIASAIPFTPGSDFALMVQTLGKLDINQLNQALISLSPVNFGALEWINARNNSYVADIISKHVFDLSCSPRDCRIGRCNRNSAVWLAPFGNFMSNIENYDNLQRFDADAAGIVGGLDYCFGCNYYIGAGFGYTHTNLQWKHHHGHGIINSYYGALYGSFQANCFDIDFSAIGGGSNNDLRRKISFADVNRTAKSDPQSTFFTGHLGARFEWTSCQITLEPFGLADYHYFHRDGFKESRADSLNLKVQDKNQHMLRAEAGLKSYYTCNYYSPCWGCECSCFAPYLGLSWVGEYPLGTSKQKASFIDQTCVIDVTSFDSSVHLISPQAGLKWSTSDGFSLLIGYKGLFNNKTRINEVEGRLEWVF